MKFFLLDLKKLLAPFVRTIPRILITASLLFIFSCSAVNYSGFCWSKKRYLSDQEKINSAIDYRLSWYPQGVEIYEVIDDKKIYVAPRSIPINPVYYKDRKEFLASNKNCCEAHKSLTHSIDLNDGEPIKIPFFRRILGFTSDLIHIKYLVKYKDSDGDIVSQLHSTSMPVSNCGNAKSQNFY